MQKGPEDRDKKKSPVVYTYGILCLSPPAARPPKNNPLEKEEIKEPGHFSFHL